MARTKRTSKNPQQPEDAAEQPIRVYQHASYRRQKARKLAASTSHQPPDPTSQEPVHEEVPITEPQVEDNDVIQPAASRVPVDDHVMLPSPPPGSPARDHVIMPSPPQDALPDDQRGQNDDENEEDIPDPQDTSLLASYPDHVASAIWQGKERGLLGRGCNRKWRMPLVDDLPEAVKEIVQTSGLAPLVGLSYKTIDKRLLSSFVERWYSDTNTFHLPVGEMTVTLDDVSALLHIPVKGKLIGLSKPPAQEAIDMMKSLLGVSQKWAWDETQKNRGGAVRFLMLEKLFHKLVTKGKYIEAARCYLLCLIGTTIFLDKSMTYVGCQYLPPLEDVGNIQQYGWGACALAHLYAELTAASLKKTKQLGGYGTMLEAWIKEYFPNIGSAIPRQDYKEDMPRASKWEQFIAPGNMDKQYRSHLESLRIDQVRWQPYDPDHRQHRLLEEATFYSGYLRCGDIRRAYLPERVLRQFGYVQSIPRAPPTQLPDFSDIDAAYDMWTEHVLDDATRGRLGTRPGEVTRTYFDWLHEKSHPYMLPESQRVQQTEPTRTARYQQRLNRIGELIRRLQAKGLDDDEISQIQTLCHVPIEQDIPVQVQGQFGRRVRKRS